MGTWKRTGKTVNKDGTVIRYENGGLYAIESRLVHVPHANGYPGTWDHTEYFVMQDDQDLKNCCTLKHAKQVVEEYEAMDEQRHRLENGEIDLNFVDEEGGEAK